METEDGTVVMTHRELDVPEPSAWDLSGDAMYFRVRTEAEAKNLLEKLAVKTPGVTWGMFTLTMAASAAPGPVNYTVVTDKGVLPA
jgi:hypothetical protein